MSDFLIDDAMVALPAPMPTKRDEWMAMYVSRMVERGIHADDAWALCRSGESDHDYDSDPAESADNEMVYWEQE
jgi:hypothetical protein